MPKLTLKDLEGLARDDMGEFLNRYHMNGCAAEIGVMFGGFARTILGKWKGEIYYAVDLWRRLSAEEYRERTEGIDYEACYQQVQAMAEADPRICVIRHRSVNAARFVPDQCLDWVFIDANHSYRAVLADMDAWWPKVRPGGIFSGHDYGLDTNWPNFTEVKPAVDRWSQEHNLPFVLGDKGSTWYALKPWDAL